MRGSSFCLLPHTHTCLWTLAFFSLSLLLWRIYCSSYLGLLVHGCGFVCFFCLLAGPVLYLYFETRYLLQNCFAYSVCVFSELSGTMVWWLVLENACLNSSSVLFPISSFSCIQIVHKLQPSSVFHKSWLSIVFYLVVFFCLLFSFEVSIETSSHTLRDSFFSLESCSPPVFILVEEFFISSMFYFSFPTIPFGSFSEWPPPLTLPKCPCILSSFLPDPLN